ncbi:sugar phosphate isomerase/epimerase family protein [Segetibacter koreensis]|uniref:sugar phosphate isomerase/epimerase family protein n=1 Tax=Segetibacter koreensis TaxID=398037 RepID=UPI000374D713|nr:sugar phosphate isomerase/epimerase family protein [Segetibacter koreensis]
MTATNRRSFLLSTALASGLPILKGLANTAEKRDEQALKNISLGVISGANNPEEELKVVRDLGFPTCQLNIKDYSPELAKRLTATLENYKLSATTLICMGPGTYTWDLVDGPSTIGLIPRETRVPRIERLKQGIDFCKAAGIPAVHAHFGFIPENPKDALYTEFIGIMKPICEYALKKGIDVYFETGQETPVTLLRALEDIGTGNLFVNYDTANLVLYGKANPLDGLKVLGKYVRSFHAKDGLYPTNPNELGKEVLIPKGEVNFPAIISFLKKMNFKGNITIECELSGDNKDYIVNTKRYLEKLISA